jgi:bifunctional non-homologous end joining protein LigD
LVDIDGERDPPLARGRSPILGVPPDAADREATEINEVESRGDGWAVKVKWDGVRAIAYCQPGRLELQTRNLNVVTAQYPEVRRLTRQLGSRVAVLDLDLAGARVWCSRRLPGGRHLKCLTASVR